MNQETKPEDMSEIERFRWMLQRLVALGAMPEGQMHVIHEGLMDVLSANTKATIDALLEAGRSREAQVAPHKYYDGWDECKDQIFSAIEAKGRELMGE